MASLERIRYKSSASSSYFEVIHEVSSDLNNFVTHNGKVSTVSVFRDIHTGDSIAGLTQNTGFFCETLVFTYYLTWKL